MSNKGLEAALDNLIGAAETYGNYTFSYEPASNDEIDRAMRELDAARAAVLACVPDIVELSAMLAEHANNMDCVAVARAIRQRILEGR